MSTIIKDFLEKGLIRVGSDLMLHGSYERFQYKQFVASKLLQGSVLSAHHTKGLEELILQVKGKLSATVVRLVGSGMGIEKQCGINYVVFTSVRFLPVTDIQF